MRKGASVILPDLCSYKYAQKLCNIAEPNYTRRALLLFAIYENPDDFPGKFVARLYDTTKATEYCTVRDTLEEARASIPPGLSRIGRSCFDPRELVETWF